MNQEKIGKFLAQLRKEKNITQQELANKLGVTDKAISKWENGRCLMDISLLKPVSEILNVSVIEIINGEKIETDNVYTKSNELVESTLSYAERKIRKNKIQAVLTSLVIFIIVLMIGFISYKGIMLFVYNTDKLEQYEEFIKGISFDKTIKIYKKTINENEYLIEDDVKLRNDFKDYERTFKEETNGFVKYFLYDENNKVKSAFWMGKTDQYINMFTSDELNIYMMENPLFRGNFNEIDRKYFLLKNDINDDLDFFEYIKNNYYLESNIFTSDRGIRENYALNLFVQIVFPLVDSITVISGDYTGYIYNINDRIREAHIFRNDKSYVFTFIGEELATDSYIIELLSTLEIK